MIKVHLIDDDTALHELLTAYFDKTAIAMTASELPSQGLETIQNHKPDLVILDLMLPEMDGFEVCKQLRQLYPLLPIIMLTAKGDDINKILGLELGADDYMAKPFNPRELEARIKTIMRRMARSDELNQQPKQQLSSEYWDLHLDLDARSVTRQEQVLDFTATEFDLLRILLENQGIVQSRDALMTKMKGYEWESFDRTIDMYISKIRQKIETNPKKPEIVKTVWGIGYIFAPE